VKAIGRDRARPRMLRGIGVKMEIFGEFQSANFATPSAFYPAACQLAQHEGLDQVIERYMILSRRYHAPRDDTGTSHARWQIKIQLVETRRVGACACLVQWKLSAREPMYLDPHEHYETKYIPHVAAR